MLRINDEAPNFTAETSQGTIDFHKWMGDGWAMKGVRRLAPLNLSGAGLLASLRHRFHLPHRAQRIAAENLQDIVV